MSGGDGRAEASPPGGWSRRALIGGAAALGASATLVAPLGGALAAPAEAPRKGGLLRLGLAGGAVSDSLEPATYADSAMICAGRGLFNGLVELTADGKAAPELATSWDTRGSAAEWVFNLRKGVRFSDGRNFDADDAIYSLNLHRGDARSRAASLMLPVKDVRKLDRYQIQISLDAPDADFPLTLTDCHLLMAPQGFKDWAKPVGTGGYLLDQFDPGARIALKRTRDYWRDGRGNLDAAEISVMSEGAERVDALVSRQVDVINRVDHRVVPLLAKTPKVEIVRAAGGWHAAMAMRTDMAPYDNPDIRLALKYAVDREQVLKALFGGYGAIGNDHPVPASDPFFNKELTQRRHDPDRAAFHLKKAGIDAAMVLQASEAAFAGALEMAALVQASAGKAGLKLDVKKESPDGFWDNVWLKGAFVESCWAGRPAATHMLSVAYGADAPLNETHWKNDRFEKLLADARSETDESKRKSYVWDMQAILRDDGGAVIPVFRDWIDAHRDNVGGHTPHAGFEMDNGYILDKAYLKA